MNKILALFVINLLVVCSFSQIIVNNNFINLTVADGLPSNTINDIYIQDKSNVWIATPAGLSHYDGNLFTNYTTTSSALNSNNIKELAFSQNKIWLLTDAGLSNFNGTSFINFDMNSGLVSNNIEAIAGAKNDTLWLTTQSGTQKYDGSFFTTYLDIKGRDIESDSIGRIYVMRSSIANNFPFAHLYDNGNWSLPSQNGISSQINEAKLVKTTDNNLFLTGNASNPTNYYQINYPLNCVAQPVYLRKARHSISANNVEISLQQLEEFKGTKWIGGGNGVPLYHAALDSNFASQYIINTNAVSSCIKAKDYILAIGTNAGLFLTRANIKKGDDALELSVNNIKTVVNITDPLFTDEIAVKANFEIPKGSGMHGIYSANFIVAAKKLTENNYTVHPINGFGSTYLPGPKTTEVGISEGVYMVKISRQQIENHKIGFSDPSYIAPKGIIDWPAVGNASASTAFDLAPFFDSNNNNCYDPLNGDYPIIKGDEAIYWINHPINQNLDLEYHWMMYGFNDNSNKSLNQSIFLEYTIVNRSPILYDSVQVGFFIDSDLGNGTDDYVGSDSLNNLLYFYNGDAVDENNGVILGYNKTTPSVGVKFLSDSLVNAIYFVNGASAVNGDPSNAGDWLNYLNSRWKSGQPVKFGGDGLQSMGVSNINTNFMYTGNPASLTNWTELTPGGGQQSNSPGDRRMFGRIPNFALQPNGRKTIEIALGYGRTADSSSLIGKNVLEMKSILNGTKIIRDSIKLPIRTFAKNDSCLDPNSINEIDLLNKNTILIYPNPSKGELTIKYQTRLKTIEIYDMRGALVLSMAPNLNTVKLTLLEKQEGFYLIRVQKEDSSWETKKIILMK